MNNTPPNHNHLATTLWEATYPAYGTYNISTRNEIVDGSLKLARTFTKLGTYQEPVAMQQYRGGDKQSFYAINDSLTPEEIAALPHNPLVGGIDVPLAPPALRLKKGQKFQDVRLPRPESTIPRRIARFVGQLATTAAATATGYEVLGAQNLGEIFGFVGGFFVAYEGRQYFAERRVKHSQRSLQALAQKIRDPNRGAIVFKDSEVTIQLPHPVTPDEQVASNGIYPLLKRYINYDDVQFVADVYKVMSLKLNPAQLIQQILIHTAEPRDLWDSGFGNQTREFAQSVNDQNTATSQIESIHKRVKFTGIEMPGEIESAQNAVKQAQADLGDVTLALFKILADHVNKIAHLAQMKRESEETQKRYLKCVALFDKIAAGTDKSASEAATRYNLHLQPFYDIATVALGKYDLESPETLRLATQIHDYLRGTRALLTSPTQMEQFYLGFRKRVNSTDFHLPEWQEVASFFDTKLPADQE